MKILSFVLMAFMLSCTKPLVSPNIGIWAGETINMKMEIKETNASLEFGCAFAEIPNPILLDKNKKFNIEGTYTRTPPVVMKDYTPTVQKAIFTGNIIDNKMNLKMQVDNTTTDMVLVYGKDIQIFKCL